MNLENEDQRITNSDSEKFDAVLTGPKISYTRDFLLSLSSLDACKKLPSGFDESLLSEFGEGSESGLDRPRNTSSLQFQGFRRTQYSSSPPTQGDSNDNSRGFHGKWESRRSDRDSDSQSDKDSDSGRRYGHQSRGTWHTREQDGLLGSGSLARPFGYTSGMSAPKTRPIEQYQPNKSNEPYHPLRPYKPVLHTRRDTDSYNDETFGSVESTSEDRAEEERKRRASFETMRKEHQRILRDKQKSNLGKHKDGSVADICEILDDSRDGKELDARNNETELSTGIPIVSSNDLEKHSLPSNSPASIPLVPPGFKNNILEKNIGSKSMILHNLSEEPVMGTAPLDVEINLSTNGTKNALEHQLARGISFADGKPAADVPHAVYQEENVNALSSLDAPIKILSKQYQFSLSSNHFNSKESLDDLDKVKLNAETLGGIVGDLNKNHSTSVIEEFLDATLTIGDNGSTTADHYGMPNAPNSVQSSKFVQWFFEEETKLADVPSETRRDLLSIIVNGDKGRHKVSTMEATEHFSPDFTYQTLEQMNQVKFEGQSPSNEISDQQVINNNEDIIPAVVTCEDLEQSILSEYSGNSTIMQPLSTENTEQKHPHVDGYASSHLLSLLKKGTESSINPVVNINSANNLPGSPDNGMVGTSHKLKWVKNNDNLSNSVNTLTLEALFGTDFMNELQSVDAPVSVQRGSTGSDQVDTSDPPGLPFPVSDVDSSPIINISGPQRPSHNYGFLTSNHVHQTRLNMSQNWHVSEDPQNDMISLKHTEAATKNIGRQAFAEIQLPEKILISSNDPQNQWMSKLMSIGSSSNRKNSSLDGGKLAPFSDVKNQLMVGSEILPSTHDHHEQLMSQIPFRNPQMQQSFTQLQTPQISSMRPLYHHLDSHPVKMSSDMTFLGPESIFTHDSSAIHQFPSNVNRPSLRNTRGSGFEIPSHPAILRHQMQLPGNRPFILPDLSRGSPVSHHGNQSTVFIQENQIRHLPFDPRMANIGSRGVPFSDVNSVGNPPEAFQRLIQIELRANSKQSQTVPRRNQGFHGLEPDMGFQYG